MIPKNITKLDILKGIEKVKLTGFSRQRESDDYDLFYMTERYPPKVIISFANVSANGFELPSGNFGGGDEANLFLIERGFPILQKESKNPTNFFTKQELSLFDRYAGEMYNFKSEIDVNAGFFIGNVIWGRCKLWAQKLCEVGRFRVAGRKAWNEQRNNQVGQAFKGYAWYKLHHNDLDNEAVFYTVGVEGSCLGRYQQARLVIKLDCLRNKLDRSMVNAFDELLVANNIVWKSFENEFVIDGSWNTLIEDSIAYVDSTFEIYKKAIWLFNRGIERKYARITWNKNGWVFPSGVNGKSVTISHEKEFGYGHEEWLFDFEKTIEGYKYGRLEPLDVKSGKHNNKIYDITLYAHDQEERKWYWIGRIMKAEVLSPEQSIEVTSLYRQNGWLSEEIEQLKVLNSVNYESYRNWPDNDRFNLRFKPEHIELYGPQEFKSDENAPSLRYVLAEKKASPKFLSDSGMVEEREKGIDFVENEITSSPKKLIRRRFKEQLSELDNVHTLVQAELMKYLKMEFPNSKFGHEIRKKNGGYRIDIVEERANGDYVFYEIKTYPIVLQSIRIALGQLLEYAYYSKQRITDKFVIVTHLSAPQSDLDYLEHISREFRISLSYMWFDLESKTVIK